MHVRFTSEPSSQDQETNGTNALLNKPGDEPQNSILLHLHFRVSSCDSFGTHEQRKPTMNTQFLGALIDTGSESCVIGLSQALDYAHTHCPHFNTSDVSYCYQFGECIQQPCGVINISTPTPTGDISVRADVVDIDIPVLLCLQVLNQQQFQVCNIVNALVIVSQTLRLPFMRIHGLI